MPIYEYQCAACGGVVEKWQKFSEPPLTACPHCGGSLSKLISSCAFHLKGGGWYVSEYGGKHPGADTPKNNGNGTDAGGGADAKPGEKSDSSPAPKLS
jgi:putative FmdB family regulatory protein